MASNTNSIHNDDDDDDHPIAIIYKGDMVGKKVYLKFRVENEQQEFMFFEGTITRYQKAYDDDDITKSLQYMHYVKFGDSDDGFYDLSDMEMTGYLKWKLTDNDHTGLVAAASASSTNGSTSSPSSTIDIAQTYTSATQESRVQNGQNGNIVTPTKKRKQQNQTTVKKAKVKLEPGSTLGSNYQRGNDAINLVEFEHWLRNVHRGANGNALSEGNVRSVMNRVRDLVSGRGISYKNWPNNVKFYQGTQVDLTMNFETLLKKAESMENQYGEDKGHGWLLRHPIKKLLLYKEHVEEWGKR